MISTKPHPPLRILLIDDDPKRAIRVERNLAAMGFNTHCFVGEQLRALKIISTEQPDIIIVMESPGREILESLAILSQHQPTPVAMISNEEDPDYIDKAIAAGVSTYQVGDIGSTNICRVIDVALAQFRKDQQLRRALTETRQQLSDRHIIDEAKHVLMNKLDLSEHQAYQHLRTQAMNCNSRLADVARRVLKASADPANSDCFKKNL